MTSARAIAVALSLLSFSSAVSGNLWAAVAPAASACDESPKPGAKETDPRAGCGKPTIEGSVAFESAYVFRGYNVFQETHQDEQKWVAKPRLLFTDASERLSIGYGAAFQLNGDNLDENVDKGLGSEQIAFADYDFTLSPSVVLSPEIGAYFYPVASSVPLLVEGSAELWYLGPVELGAFVGYLGAVREGPLTEDYFYFSPRVAKTLEFGTHFEFGVQLTAGVKVRTRSDATDNTVDVLLAEYLRYSLTDALFVSVNWAVAWTNLGPHEDPVTKAIVTPGFGDECAPFWGFALGAEL